MATRVTDGARRERHEKRDSFFFSGCRPRFARLAASPLPRACIALTKSEEKERLLAVYIRDENMVVFYLVFHLGIKIHPLDLNGED